MSSDPLNELVTANVSDGIRPRFGKPFLDRYGADSEFVRAVADVYTLALARLLERANQLADPAGVARISDNVAVGTLHLLITNAPSVKRTLLQEALGSISVGSVAEQLDGEFGAGTFRRWLSAFESRDYEGCSRAVHGAVERSGE